MDSVARVSDLADVSGVRMLDTPPAGAFIVVFYLPEADIIDVDKAHDVVIYDDHRSPEDAHGFFDRVPAAEHAVEEAKERDVPLLKNVYEYEDEYRKTKIDDVDW